MNLVDVARCGDHTLPVPITIDDVEPAWLTAQLRSAGYSADVASFTPSPIGNGMMASTYRLALQHRGHAEDQPASVTIKLTAPGEVSRRTARRGFGFPGRPGFYGQEVIFYATYAAQVHARVPQPYFAWIADEGDRFVLLLEDIDPARPGNDLDGCTHDEAVAAVRNMAGLHAALWDSPQFAEPGFLQRPTGADGDVYQRFIDSSIAHFAEQFGDTDHARHLPMLHEFGSKARAWFLAEGERVGLTHNDFRLDNLLFTGNADGCVVLDWQTFMVSHIGRDLGLFIGASLPTELRLACGDELLAAYRDELTSHGVTCCSQSDTEHDLRYGSFHGIHNALLLHRAVDMTDRGTQMFDAWLGRACQTVDDLEALDVLP